MGNLIPKAKVISVPECNTDLENPLLAPISSRIPSAYELQNTYVLNGLIALLSFFDNLLIS
jgi:hypothetical protein